MTVQKLFLMPFPKKTCTLMPLSKCRLKILIFCLIVVFIHLQNTLIPISCVFHIHFLLSNLRTFVFYNKYLLCKRFHFFSCFSLFPNIFFDNDYVCSCRNSHRRCSIRKGVLKSFAKFTGKCVVCRSLLPNLCCSFRHVTLFKKNSEKGVFQ